MAIYSSSWRGTTSLAFKTPGGLVGLLVGLSAELVEFGLGALEVSELEIDLCLRVEKFALVFCYVACSTIRLNWTIAKICFRFHCRLDAGGCPKWAILRPSELRALQHVSRGPDHWDIPTAAMCQ
jgi:hypothetical protein